ncbi:type IV secretion system protein VirB10 [Neorhizobium sp. T786]|uniref:type IV secretion system protein VirB10 n=1 Tax=Pseudorhizobium xiangyangii TaxID=2883104 RepID=UPI001CFF97B3|nr:type IV secretion system protein VirB10 [Neorhizobium xiangyangii]MCB5205170.1 type IV secretion system protein VirB10 [Neorhizobium xiangyangii]
MHNPKSTEAEELGERDAEILGERKTANGPNTKVKLAVVAAAVIGVGGIFYMASGESEEKQEETRAVAVRNVVPFQAAPEEKPEEEPEPEPVATEAEEEAVEVEEIDELLEAARRAPVLITSGSSMPRSAPSEMPVSGDGSGSFGEERQLSSMLRSSPQASAKAGVIANLHMTVPKGTHIPCTLETALSSDQPGLVSCIVARDVLGASGQVVLAEKGSKILGEYEGGMTRGKARIFVLWTEMRTPSGVVVQLNSPASDALGRSGFNGKIDSKFKERFGGAMLMSVISDASNFAFGRLTDQAEVEAGGTESTSNEAIATILKESLSIEPTLYKNQGESVSVFVARDLDFAGVYQLKRTAPMHQIYDRAVHGTSAISSRPTK